MMDPSAAIEASVRLLVEAANPRRIILFGSHARGAANATSDIDLLIVFDRVTSRRAETVHLLDVLRPLRIPVDVVVVSEESLREWGAIAGTIYHEALTAGRVLYEAA